MVTGPRQAVPSATATHTRSRSLHSSHTAWVGRTGFRPASVALTTSMSWSVSTGQPRSSRSTDTWSAIGVDVASVSIQSGRA